MRLFRIAARAVDGGEDQGSAQHGEDADAGDRAVRRADQARHITADRRDDDARDEDIGERQDEDGHGVEGDRAALREVPEQHGYGRERGEDGAADDADRQVALGKFEQGAVASLAPLCCRDGGADAADDWPQYLEEGPDRRDADRARADEARFHAEGGADDFGNVGSGWQGRGEPGDEADPTDQQADEHRDADRQADQMADADQRHGKAG